jgi:hypothetical protein
MSQTAGFAAGHSFLDSLLDTHYQQQGSQVIYKAKMTRGKNKKLASSDQLVNCRGTAMPSMSP